MRELFDRSRRRRLSIRLLGIALSNLGPYDRQLRLFGDDAPLYRAVDDIRERYGYDAMRLALASSRD